MYRMMVEGCAALTSENRFSGACRASRVLLPGWPTLFGFKAWVRSGLRSYPFSMHPSKVRRPFPVKALEKQ